MIRQYKKDIAIVLFFMLAAGLLSITQIESDYVITNDGCSYAKTGKNLAEGKGYTYMGEPNLVFPPVYPYLISLLYRITGDAQSAGIYVSIMAWILSVIPVYLISKMLFKGSRTYASITLLIFVTTPVLNTMARRVQAEAVYILLLLGTVYLLFYLLFKGKSLRILHFVIIGAAFGLTTLARPEGFIFLLLSAAVLFFVRIKEWKKVVPLLLIMIITSLFILSPYMIYLKKETGHWLLSGRSHLTIVHGEDVWADDYDLRIEKKVYEITPDRRGVRMYRGMYFSVPEYFLNNLSDTFKRLTYNFKAFMYNLFKLIFPVGIVLLLFLFVPVQGKVNYDKKIALILPLFIAPIFLNMFFRYVHRHLLQYLVFLLFLVAIGLYKAGVLALKRFDIKKWLLVGLQVLIILLMNYQIFHHYIHPPEDRERTWHEHKEMGLWMKANIDNISEKRIVSRKALVAFYADGIYKALPWVENRFELFYYLENVHADYLIVDTRYFKYLRPKIEYLLDTHRKFKPLEHIKTIDYRKEKIVLYKFKGYY